MGLSIQQLHTQVTHLAQENGDATGKLRGAVAANTQGSFQGLTVSNGARETEKAFAMDILKHTSNIILNSYDQAELFSGSARLGKNNFVLEQVGGGQSRFVGLKSDQLTLRDAKILLEAAMRPPVPLRSNTPPPIQMGSDIPPPVPARNGTPPPIPARSAVTFFAGSERRSETSGKYDQQFILDSGSGKSAEGIALKAKSNGLKTQSVSLASSAGHISEHLKGITYNSRVYIIGHGFPGVGSIVSDQRVRISAQDYANGIAEALAESKSEYNEKPLVVSVMACFGGSSSTVLVNNSQEALELRADNPYVDIVWPSRSGQGYGCLRQGFTTLDQAKKISHYSPNSVHNSFAEQLAQNLSQLGINAEVKGRTNTADRTDESRLENIRAGDDVFSKRVKHRHHVEGDKVGFIAQGGNINKVVYDYK